MPKRFLTPINHLRPPRHGGEKCINLHRLQKKGFRIPLTYSISWDLQTAWEQNNGRFPDGFRRDLDNVLAPQKAYAVRSSANVEDNQSQSYAGQFLSVLEVQGTENVMAAIQSVWHSSQLEGPHDYHSQQNSETKEIKMGVVLQEMVPAKFSGVAFSRNPITGMDEVLIETVQGNGVALVQEGVTPQRWIWKWGKWLQQPESPTIPQEVILTIILETREISETFGFPVDLEWAYDGKNLFWLQMRAITALQTIDIYANHIPKEFMPGVIKPLVWSVNVPLVNGAWVQLLTEMIGKNQLDPLRLAKSFYGHAYFNMGVLGAVFQQLGMPDNALERLMGFEGEKENGPSFRPSLKSLKYLPRFMMFMLDKLFRIDRKFEDFFLQAQKDYTALDAIQLNDLNGEELLQYIQKLYALNQRTAYFNIVIPLLMQIHHQLAKRRLAKKGMDYEQFNWLADWEQRAAYDPIPHLNDLGKHYHELTTEEQDAVFETHVESPTVNQRIFQQQLTAFLDRFGHLNDSGNDFSSPLWKETPEIVLNLIVGFAESNTADKSANNHATALSQNLNGHLMKRAARYSRYREEISFLYTHGFSMFRPAYQRIGEIFCASVWLEHVEDVFFLKSEEIRAAIQQGEYASSLKGLTLKRKEDHKKYHSVNLPPVIYGNQPPPILDQTTATLTGIPTSRGIHRGIVRVVKGIRDFPKVIDGCVLVIPFSDVSWTPLFSRAGALVTEAGGMLSHSSIVAREYGIPAIVSVQNATNLQDDIEVTVDGYTGNIILHESNLEGGPDD